MHSRGTLFQCSFLHTLRLHAGKAVILVIMVLILLEYSLNMVICRDQINKMVAPGLTWFSNSLTTRLGINTDKVPGIWDNSQPCTFNCDSNIVNSSLNKLSNVSHSETAKMNVTMSSKNTTSHKKSLEECPLVPPKLVGRLKVLTDPPSFEALEALYYNLQPGGRYKPPDCISRNKVALIIPYRNREKHLRIFLHNMHPILQRQQLDYGIYVIEESGDTKFNRAMLMNIGFVEALKQYGYDCFVFHDVDLIPEDDRNLYTCPEQPRHMSVAINTMNYRLPYKDIFGGVSALTKKHMETVNGFSNEFWGWGGEDDDMSNRYNKLYKGKYRFKKDGLSNLKYKRIDLVFKKLYTWVLVEIEPIQK